MSKAEKLLIKAINNPQNVRYDEACKLAEHVGFILKGGKGCHRVYSKKGITEILTLQEVNGMAKPYQVRQLLKIINEYNLTGE